MTKTYKTVQGDQWDLVSYKMYGNERYMHVLLEANPEYQDLTVFPAGLTLTCPDIPTPQSIFSPPWSR